MDIDQLLKGKAGICLDIGGGERPQKGFVNMDVRPLPTVDIVWNAEQTPWPLPDECVITAMASHLVEHINPASGGFLRFMDEVWRVCKPGAQFVISTPYGGSPGYWQDPTHVNGCNENTWRYFDPAPGEDPQQGFLWAIYKPRPWKLEYLSWDPVQNMEVILRKRSVVRTETGEGVILSSSEAEDAS